MRRSTARDGAHHLPAAPPPAIPTMPSASASVSASKRCLAGARKWRGCGGRGCVGWPGLAGPSRSDLNDLRHMFKGRVILAGASPGVINIAGHRLRGDSLYGSEVRFGTFHRPRGGTVMEITLGNQ